MTMEFFVHPSSYLDENVEIGNGTRIWHFTHIQSGSKIGESCTIGQNVNISNNVKIGNNVKIQNNVSVYEGVEIEDFVFCGPSMVFTNDLTPRSKYPKGSVNFIKTKVRLGATIGANATVLCGITIGKFALIGAGAVVIKDIPNYSIQVGNPSRHVGWVCECGEKLGKNFKCNSCHREYVINDHELMEKKND